MRAVGSMLFGALLGSMVVMGAGREKVMRQEKDKIFSREAEEVNAPEGANLEVAEADAMSAFADTRWLANVGCQYATENVIILDNSYAMFDKELWMFKLLIKEIAAAFLRVNSNSRLGLILSTDPTMPLIPLASSQSQDITSLWQTIKGIQRTQTPTGTGDIGIASETAVEMFSFNQVTLPKTYNILLLVGPYAALPEQVAVALTAFSGFSMLRRFVVGTRITASLQQEALEAYAGCSGCGHVLYVGKCTPARFLFLIKRVYPLMCVPEAYYRDAAMMTFQIDGMPVDDNNLPEFVDQFLGVVSQATGVDREYLEVIDVRDSTSTSGPQYNARRLKSIDSFADYPQDTLLDIVVREQPNNLRDTPFVIASRLDTDLRNDLSPVSTLFSKELNGVPKLRNITQPRESIFSRPNQGLTFHNLYLGDGLNNALADRTPLSELLSS